MDPSICCGINHFKKDVFLCSEKIYIYLCHRCSGNIKIFFFEQIEITQREKWDVSCLYGILSLKCKRREIWFVRYTFIQRHLRVLAKVRYQTKYSNPTLCINGSIFPCVHFPCDPSPSYFTVLVSSFFFAFRSPHDDWRNNIRETCKIKINT